MRGLGLGEKRMKKSSMRKGLMGIEMCREKWDNRGGAAEKDRFGLDTGSSNKTEQDGNTRLHVKLALSLKRRIDKIIAYIFTEDEFLRKSLINMDCKHSILQNNLQELNNCISSSCNERGLSWITLIICSSWHLSFGAIKALSDHFSFEGNVSEAAKLVDWRLGEFISKIASYVGVLVHLVGTKSGARKEKTSIWNVLVQQWGSPLLGL